MGNYKELQKYLENTGKTEIKLSFDNLKNILNIEVNYAIVLRLQKEFQCSYMVYNISKQEKWVGFCKIETQNNDDDDATVTTLASMLWR